MPENRTSQQFTLSVSAPEAVGLVDCRLHTPILFRVENRGGAAACKLVAESADGLISRFERELRLPENGSAEIQVPDLFSPTRLAGETAGRAFVTARLLFGGREVCRAETPVLVLPYGFWEGTAGDASRLAAFARPDGEDCARVLKMAREIAKRRNGVEFHGYGDGKHAALSMLFSVFSAVAACAPVCAPSDLNAPVSVRFDGVFGGKEVTEAGLGVFVCSCLEAAGLHPVLAVGDRVAAGAWLYDSEFLSPCTETDSVLPYLREGAENLALFEIADLFAGSKVSFAQSGRHFGRTLSAGGYSRFVDFSRCRKEGIGSIPPRRAAVSELSAREEIRRAAEWERELTGDARDPLLHFTGKGALRVACTDADALLAVLLSGERLRLVAGGDSGDAARERELEELERARGALRVYAAEGELRTAAARMARAERLSEEETGAGVLFLSFGLCTFSDGRGKRSAPLSLLPVSLTRGENGHMLRAREGGLSPNAALLEFLRQKTGKEPPSPFGVAALRAFAESAGATVSDETYLSVFAFHGYAIAGDVRRNLGEFCKNAAVRALLERRAEAGAFSGSGAPEGAPLTVLPTDGAQDEAIALSDAGGSFVLHGPPGTGKSQTIANILANALHRGRRVLFVAEKRAALDVVGRRLEGAGLGDFCLKLSADREKAAEVARKILQTLSLSATDLPEDRAEAEFFALEKELDAPVAALHEKGRLGTPAEAIFHALSRRNAPALAGGTAAFYGSLTEENLPAVRHELVAAAAAVCSCGKLRGAPFSNVGLPAYNGQVRDAVRCVSETLLASCAHAERMLALFSDAFGATMPLRTSKRLHAAMRLAARLCRGEDAPFLETPDAIGGFCEANRVLDERLDFYFRRFRALAETDAREELSRFAKEGGNWHLSYELCALARRLARLARTPIDEADMPKYFQTLSDIYDCAARIKGAGTLSRLVCDGNGQLVYGKRAEVLKQLFGLRRAGEEAFGELGDSFYSACARLLSSAHPLLRGVSSALGEFFEARREYLRTTGGKESGEGDVLSESAAQASALLENLDLLRGWCRMRESVQRLERAGAGDLGGLLAQGIGEKELVAAFDREVYRRYAEECVRARAELKKYTAEELEERAERYRDAANRRLAANRAKLRAELISRLPGEEDEEFAAERAALLRAERGRGGSVRSLFAAAPRLIFAACPCMLLSPAAVAQYLPPESGLFDLVVFDEASQMPTAEAVGSLGRARAAIVVGDPNQLPPTRFFRTGGEGEEDGESVLDEFLALGMPQRRLRWHYRSRHESLIAFSNAAYYGGSLMTVPAKETGSRVKSIRTDGAYSRGKNKRNRGEAEAVVGEVIRRLSDPILAKRSMGVVAFSLAQREEIERLIARALEKTGLFEAAYGGEEPLFIKNLENVQGDERDVILFSVGYGPDQDGKLTRNFGPLNRAGGWRRLNVAASRAREEMLVFCSFPSSALCPPLSRGVAELKAFLEFAENGKTLSVFGEERAQIGAIFAKELARCGYSCRLNVGASAFKADVAVLDPRGGGYLLAVLTDGEPLPARERYLVREEALRRAGWEIAHLSAVDFYANPQREIERIKRILDGLCGRKPNARLSRFERKYRYAPAGKTLSGDMEPEEIRARLEEIVAHEQPISRAFLKKRFLDGSPRRDARLLRRLDRLIDGCSFSRDVAAGVEYFYFSPRALAFDRFRTEGKRALRKDAEDFSAYEIVSMIRGALEDDVALYPDDLSDLFGRTFRRLRADGELAAFLLRCVRYGEERGVFSRSFSERITLR